jgi:hypothetical protein
MPCASLKPAHRKGGTPQWPQRLPPQPGCRSVARTISRSTHLPRCVTFAPADTSRPSARPARVSITSAIPAAICCMPDRLLHHIATPCTSRVEGLGTRNLDLAAKCGMLGRSPSLRRGLAQRRLPRPLGFTAEHPSASLPCLPSLPIQMSRGPQAKSLPNHPPPRRGSLWHSAACLGDCSTPAFRVPAVYCRDRACAGSSPPRPPTPGRRRLPKDTMRLP